MHIQINQPYTWINVTTNESRPHIYDIVLYDREEMMLIQTRYRRSRVKCQNVAKQQMHNKPQKTQYKIKCKIKYLDAF